MSPANDAPQAVGPWSIGDVNFAEPSRSSYRATTRGLTADILILDVAPGWISVIDGDLTGGKKLYSHELPGVLDWSLGAQPRWIASEAVAGARLQHVVRESGPLDPQSWAELAKTALIGCAALRAAHIRSFQLTGNSFVVDGSDIHMTEYWSGVFEDTPFTPEGRSSLSQLSAADDKYSIGKVLTLAMGLDPVTGIPSDWTPEQHGFSSAHVQFVLRLCDPDPAARPTTESALLSIPGRDPSWTVPVFALDKPWKPRAKRKLQRLALIGIAGVAVAAALALGINWLSQSAGQGDEVGAAPATSEPPLPGAREVQITFPNGEGKTLQDDAEVNYTVWVCYPTQKLDRTKLDRLVLEEQVDEAWRKVDAPSLRVNESRSCPKRRVALQYVAPVAAQAPLTTLWSPCRNFRLLVPEKGSTKSDSIRICVQQRLNPQE